ncbi:MAG: septum formation initiator family protein [Candidatus Falkowbacteria bacterium]
MLNNKYRLSRTKKVAYVQKGIVGTSTFNLGHLMSNQGLLSILIFGVLVLVSVPAIRNYAQERAVDLEINEAKAEIERYESKNKELSNVIGYLESDQAIEEKARLNMGLKKQGEKVAVIADRPQVSEESVVGSNPSNEKLSNPHKWLNYFFSIKPL